MINLVLTIRGKTAEVGRRADELQRTMHMGRAAAMNHAAREILPSHWVWQVVSFDGGAQLAVLRIG